MRQRSLRLWVVLAVAVILAPAVGVWAVRADIIPPTATTNAITIAIGRPNVIYHDGQVINYSVTIAVPSIIIGGDEKVGQVKNITSSATLPNGVVVPLPPIAVLNPGQSVTYTAADAPALNYVIVHANETIAAGDGHRVVVATAECDGLSQVTEGAGEPAHADVQITTHVWHPNTGVTITAVPPVVVAGAGQTVDLIVTETNTGDMNDPGLDQVSVVVNNGAVDIATLVAPPDSGDDGNAILKGSNTVDPVPETWTWTIHNVPVNAATTFTATGSGRERFGALTGNTITYPGFPTERQAVTVQTLSTLLTIASSAPAVISGGSVNLTITETNDGSAPLSNVSVAVLKNGGALATLVAPPNSGDIGNDGIMGVGETWSWTLSSGPITASTTFQATGSGTYNGVVVTYPADPDERKSVTVQALSTALTITSSAPDVVSGGSVNLTITETNDGSAPLSNVSVAVLKNGGPLATLVAPPNSGDTGNDGVMGVGETWTWIISSGPITAVTVFQATGSGTYNGVVVTYPGDPDERKSVTVQVLSTALTIASSAPGVVAGGSVNLTITETNDGNAALTNVQVAVLKNGAPLATLVAPPDSGDTGNDGILGIGETWSWTIPSGAITAATTFQATGSGEAGGVVVTYPGDPDEQKSVTVQALSTALTIASSAPGVVSGGSVNLTITETNDGSAPLSNVQVEVLKNGAPLATLVAPPDSGDTGNDGILGVGETWSWTISSGAITANTTFQATGSAQLDGVVVTYPADVDERQSVNVLMLSTGVTIIASSPAVVSGGSVNLTITETNDGGAALEDPEVVVTKNGALLAILATPPDSGDTGNDGVLGVGETWVWTLTSGPITVDPTVFEATGSAILDGVVVTWPADPDERQSTTVRLLSTVVTIGSSAASVNSGGSVDLTITETNDGAMALLSPQVVVTINGAPLATLVAPPDSGDAGNDGILGVGETWTWTLSSGPVTVNPTTFEAIGSAVLDGVVVTYPADPDERDIITVEVTTGGATRTPGFWKTHLSFTTYVFEDLLGGSMDIGWRNITSIEDLMGVFWANNARNSDGSHREDLCKARKTTSFHVVAAILNSALVNGKPMPVTLAEIQAIMSGTDIQAIKDLGSLLDTYNNSGDDVPIDSLVPIGNADPNGAKAIANIPYADCP